MSRINWADVADAEDEDDGNQRKTKLSLFFGGGGRAASSRGRENCLPKADLRHPTAPVAVTHTDATPSAAAGAAKAPQSPPTLHDLVNAPPLPDDDDEFDDEFGDDDGLSPSPPSNAAAAPSNDPSPDDYFAKKRTANAWRPKRRNAPSKPTPYRPLVC